MVAQYLRPEYFWIANVSKSVALYSPVIIVDIKTDCQ